MSDARDGTPSGTGVLWGRAAFWAAVVLLAFLAGRWSAGLAARDEPLDRLRARVARLSEENERYRRRSRTPVEESSPAAGESPSRPRSSPGARRDGRTYTVVSGDTLSEIAARFYGDPTRVSALRRVNGIGPREELSVGLELQIPGGR